MSLALSSALALLWQATWQGAVLAMIVRAIGLLPQVRPGLRRMLWLVVLVRLLLPAVPQSPWSLFNVAQGVRSAATRVAIDPTPAAKTAIDDAQRVQLKPATAEVSRVEPVNAASPVSWPLVVTAIWLCGFICMVAHGVVSLRRLRRLLNSCHVVDHGPAHAILNSCRREMGLARRVPLLACPTYTLPALAGMWHARIVISTESLRTLDADDLRWLFRHELTHVLRRDIAIGHLWWWARAIHWFNPLAWWAAANARRDAELACDEALLARVNADERLGYGHAVLRLAEKLVAVDYVPGTLAFARPGSLTARIRQIAGYRPRSAVWTTAGLALAAALLAAGLTDAMQPQPPAARVDKKDAADVKPADANNKDQSATEEKARPARTMQVLVLGDDYKPMAGATVVYSVWTKEVFKDRTRTLATDAEGRVTLELPKTIDILRVWAMAKSHVGLFAQWWPQMQEDGHLIPPDYTLRLEKGTVIGGMVTSAEGKPIEGVKVSVQLEHPQGEEMNQRPYPNTWLALEEDNLAIESPTTDAQGRWTLDNVPESASGVWLILKHPDYISDERWGALQKSQGITLQSLREQTAKIAMPRGYVVAGIVKDAQGRPLAGAIVVRGKDPYLEWGSQEVRTDEQGRYQFPPQAAGPLLVTAVAEGWAPEQITVEVAEAMPPADFQLARGKTLRLRMVDQNGAPVPKAGVSISKWRDNQGLYNHKHPSVLDTKIPARADDNGMFEWTWAPDEPIAIQCGAEGFQSVRDRIVSPSDQEQTIVMRRQ